VVAADGFHVEPSSLIVASAGFSDVQAFWDTTHRGLTGSVADMAGMAGDDDAGRAFAGRYQPAAQSVVDAAGRLFGQVGAIANGLYSLALNYIRTDSDNDVSVDKLTQTRLPESGQPECDMSSKSATVPEVIGRTEGAVEEILAKFWPQGNPGKLRQAAEDWHTLATRLETVANEGDRITRQVLAVNRSQGIDGFANTWRQLHGGGSGGTEPLIPAMRTSCRQLETACRTYADRIDKQRDDIRNLAIAAGIVAGGGIALTVVTLGISDVAAGAGEAAIAADAALLVVEFTEATAAASEIAVLAEAEAIVAEAAAALTEITPALASTTAVPGIALPAVVGGVIGALTTLPGQASAAPGGPIGPVPREPLSPFPPLTPGEQADFNAWKTRMAADGRTSPAKSPESANNPNMADADAYQRRVAGDTEYSLYTTVPRQGGRQENVNADGVRADDGAAIEAKHVGQKEGCKSPYRLDNSDGVYQPTYEKIMRDQVWEMHRYASAVDDPRNNVNHLEIITNDDKASAYFDAMMQAEHVRGNTRIVR
jgi:Restriction endonuclease fold toxin 2